MKNLADNPIQKAIYGLLSGDVLLSAMVNGIYENVPANINFPYISFGRSSTQDWSTQGTQGLQSLVVLHIYSQQSRKDVLMIRDRVMEILHDNALTLPDHHMVVMRFEQNTIDLEDNGLTYHGLIRYRVFLEALAA